MHIQLFAFHFSLKSSYYELLLALPCAAIEKCIIEKLKVFIRKFDGIVSFTS